MGARAKRIEGVARAYLVQQFQNDASRHVIVKRLPLVCQMPIQITEAFNTVLPRRIQRLQVQLCFPLCSSTGSAFVNGAIGSEAFPLMSGCPRK